MRIHEGHIVNELEQICTLFFRITNGIGILALRACIRHTLEIEDINIYNKQRLRAIYNVTYCPKSIANVNKWNGKSLGRILFSVNFNIDANRIDFFQVAIGRSIQYPMLNNK